MADDPRNDASRPIRMVEGAQLPPHMEAATIYDEGHNKDTVSERLNTANGYAVRFPHIREATWNTVNGWLYAPDDIYFPLFISEYTTSFTLSGSTAQSQMVREFYPRNFVQPEFRVSGQSPNQHYYNRLGEFVRYFQRKSVMTATPGKLLVPDSQYVPNGSNSGNRVSTRGMNRGFLAEGYIQNISRGAEFGVFAPDFSFDFTVSNMLDGLYQEDPVKINKLRSWAEIFKDENHVWTIDPDSGEIADQVAQGFNDFGDRLTLIQGWHWIQDFLGIK